MTERHEAAGHASLVDEVALDYLRRAGREVRFDAGRTIVRRGAEGRAFYVILSGAVEIRLPADGGGQLVLHRLGPGTSFGELALLRGTSVSADVVTVTPATVLEYPGERFTVALAECESLRNELLTRLAQDLGRTTADAWSFFRRAEALKLLIRSDTRPEPLIAESSPMRHLQAELGRLSSEPGPVLVSGEAGAGKLLVARLLHETLERPDAPFIALDCRRMQAGEAKRLLFGAWDEGASEGPSGFGAMSLAGGGTLVLRHVDALEESMQEQLAERLGRGDAEGAWVVATLREETGSTTAAGRPALAGDLDSRLRDRQVRVPSLRERRRDILPLARHFLRSRAAAGHLSKDAERALVSRSYRLGNVAELRETVEVAVACSDGDEIRAEHVFSGPRDAPAGFDLAQIGWVRTLLTTRVRALLRGATLAGFLAVILTCLVAGSTPAGRWANSVTWTLWEPAVFLLFLLLGRVWCTVCPLSTAGRLAQRVLSFGRPPPAWAKRFGVWLALGGFLAIVGVERVFHTPTHPLASALLLLALIGASVAFCVVYRREVWCRHVCPLGMLGQGLAAPAPLQVAANPSVCASACTTHECYKGTPEVPGCSVYHHPLYSHEGHQCKMCLNCLDSCPHGSTRLYLRPPLLGLWRLRGGSWPLAPFLLTIPLLALVVLASQGSASGLRALGLSGLGVLALALGVGASRGLPRLLFGRSEPAAGPATQAAFAALLLGWGPLMAYQLGNIPALGTLHLSAEPGSEWARYLPFSDLSVMSLGQVAFILLAALVAALALSRARALATRKGHEPWAPGWRLAALAGGLYAALAVALTLY
jgi:polyferredoxin/CRP-like cAMP-binding protein